MSQQQWIRRRRRAHGPRRCWQEVARVATRVVVVVVVLVLKEDFVQGGLLVCKLWKIF